MPATPTQKSDADAPPYRPSLHTCAEHVDYTNGLVPRHARPSDRKRALDRPGVRMANATCLDTDANMTRWRINQRFAGKFKLPRTDGLNGSIGYFGAGHLFSYLSPSDDAGFANAVEYSKGQLTRSTDHG